MVRELAEAGRLRFNLDDCRDPVIPGKFGHIYEHSDTQMGICLFHPVELKLGIRFMRYRIRKLKDLGLRLTQEGDSEACALLPLGYGPKHPIFAQVLKIAGIRKIGRARGRSFAKG